jgi:hypothetical protein
MGAILTVQEVAERMRCEHRTVRRAIGDYELREITPMAVEDFREQMTRGGRPDAAQGTVAASGHPQARGRARAHSGESSAAVR